MSATLPPQPPVRRYAKQHIDWTPDLVDWLYSSRAAPVRSIADFIRLGKGMAEDMPDHVLAREIGRRRDKAPIGPLTTVPMRRPVGRALDLGDV